MYRDAAAGLEGVDAVVDKDLAAAVLARELGAELFLILTDVDAVYTGWGTDEQRAIRSMTVAEADRLDERRRVRRRKHGSQGSRPPQTTCVEHRVVPLLPS